MGLMRKLMENSKMLKLLAPVLIAGFVASCSSGGNRTEEFESNMPYSSYGVVQSKKFSEDALSKMYGLTSSNSQGEVFDDNYYVWLENIPEFPNTVRAINSKKLYNSIAVGDTVDLTLRVHSHRVLNSESKVLKSNRWHSIEGYSPRHLN